MPPECTFILLIQVVILPFSFVFVLATDSGLNSRLAKVLGVVAEAAFLYVFWRLGAFFPILHDGQHDLFSVEGAIGRLGIAGVTTAAILSGTGAATDVFPANYGCDSSAFLAGVI